MHLGLRQMSCDGSAMEQHDQVAMCVCAEARVKSIKTAASKGLMAKVGGGGGGGGTLPKGSGHGLYAQHHQPGVVAQQVCLSKEYQLHWHAEHARLIHSSKAGMVR